MAYRAVETACRWAAALGIAALGVAMLVTVADVALRPAGGAVAGVVDLVQLGVMAAAFLTIPHAFMADAHVTVDLVAGGLSRRRRAALAGGAALLSAGLLGLLLWHGWGAAALQLRFGDRSQTLGIPLIWYWAPLLAGLCLAVLAAAAVGWRQFGWAAAGSDPLGRVERGG